MFKEACYRLRHKDEIRRAHEDFDNSYSEAIVAGRVHAKPGIIARLTRWPTIALERSETVRRSIDAEVRLMDVQRKAGFPVIDNQVEYFRRRSK